MTTITPYHRITLQNRALSNLICYEENMTYKEVYQVIDYYIQLFLDKNEIDSCLSRKSDPHFISRKKGICQKYKLYNTSSKGRQTCFNQKKIYDFFEKEKHILYVLFTQFIFQLDIQIPKIRKGEYRPNNPSYFWRGREYKPVDRIPSLYCHALKQIEGMRNTAQN